MKIDRRITGGLAWAGLVVILAVPSADILFGKPTVHADITSDMSAMRPAAAGVVPASADASRATSTSGAATEPVETSVATGTSLTVTPTAPASAKAPAAVASNAPANTAVPADGGQTSQVALAGTAPAADPPAAGAAGNAGQTVATTDQADEAPPVPMPRSMRPKSMDVATAAPADSAQPLVLDENQVRRDQTAFASPSQDFFGPDRQSDAPMITQDKLAAWNSGSLTDYLERNGLLDENSAPAAEPPIDDSYDPNGFYLSDGPNRPHRDQYYRRRYNDSWFF